MTHRRDLAGSWTNSLNSALPSGLVSAILRSFCTAWRFALCFEMYETVLALLLDL